jgi:hypothetical protein
MKIEEQYVFVTTESQEQTCIGIKEGKYKGVVYKYGDVGLGKETSDGNMPLQFKFDILQSNGLKREEFGDEFFKLAGDILVNVIDKQHKIDMMENNDNESND